MLTSFAPSPIAKHILLRLSFIILTTSAFYLGVTLQHITDSQSLAIATNPLFKIGFLIKNSKH